MTDRLHWCRIGRAMTETHRARLEQLKRALDLGAIDQDTFDAAAAGISAQMTGGGAIARGRTRSRSALELSPSWEITTASSTSVC